MVLAISLSEVNYYRVFQLWSVCKIEQFPSFISPFLQSDYLREAVRIIVGILNLVRVVITTPRIQIYLY